MLNVRRLKANTIEAVLGFPASFLISHQIFSGIGLVWIGFVWIGFVWLGFVWIGFVWIGFVWIGLVWIGFVWIGFVWIGFVWMGFVWIGFVWIGLVWIGFVWIGLVWMGFRHFHSAFKMCISRNNTTTNIFTKCCTPQFTDVLNFPTPTGTCGFT